MKRISLRGKILWSVGIVGASVIAVGFGIRAYAQTLGGTMTAVGAGAGLGAAAGAGLPTAGQATRGVRGRQSDAQNALIDEAGNAGAAGGGGAAGAGGAGGASVTVSVERRTPNNWGPGTSGSDMVNQLMARRAAPVRRTRRSSRAQAAYARRLARMTPRQRSRIINAKYQKPPVGYLSWYLKEDRYKVTSKVWQFVTTPNDRYYYRPWAPAMKLRNPSRVIGFHTWQDAMIAGYRPDPATRPEPAPQLAYLAGLTRGPNLNTYFEFVYSGQVTPATLDSHYRYVRYVAAEVRRHPHTRSLVGETVERVLGAFTGNGTFPTSVGGVTRSTATVDVGAGATGPGGIAAPPAAGAAGSDAPGAPAVAGGERRGEDYDKFRGNAAGLARKPGG